MEAIEALDRCRENADRSREIAKKAVLDAARASSALEQSRDHQLAQSTLIVELSNESADYKSQRVTYGLVGLGSGIVATAILFLVVAK